MKGSRHISYQKIVDSSFRFEPDPLSFSIDLSIYLTASKLNIFEALLCMEDNKVELTYSHQHSNSVRAFFLMRNFQNKEKHSKKKKLKK